MIEAHRDETDETDESDKPDDTKMDYSEYMLKDFQRDVLEQEEGATGKKSKEKGKHEEEDGEGNLDTDEARHGFPPFVQDYHITGKARTAYEKVEEFWDMSLGLGVKAVDDHIAATADKATDLKAALYRMAPEPRDQSEIRAEQVRKEKLEEKLEDASPKEREKLLQEERDRELDKKKQYPWAFIPCTWSNEYYDRVPPYISPNIDKFKRKKPVTYPSKRKGRDKKVVPPRFGMTKDLFLSIIGKGCAAHKSKIESWDELMTARGRDLKKKEIPTKQRRWILNWVHKYRLGIEPYTIKFKSKARKNKEIRRVKHERYERLLDQAKERKKKLKQEIRDKRKEEFKYFKELDERRAEERKAQLEQQSQIRLKRAAARKAKREAAKSQPKPESPVPAEKPKSLPLSLRIPTAGGKVIQVPYHPPVQNRMSLKAATRILYAIRKRQRDQKLWNENPKEFLRRQHQDEIELKLNKLLTEDQLRREAEKRKHKGVPTPPSLPIKPTATQSATA